MGKEYRLARSRCWLCVTFLVSNFELCERLSQNLVWTLYHWRASQTRMSWPIFTNMTKFKCAWMLLLFSNMLFNDAVSCWSIVSVVGEGMSLKSLGMIVIRENQNMWIKTSPIATLPTTDPTWTSLVLNQDFHGESPVTTARAMEQPCHNVRLYIYFPSCFKPWHLASFCLLKWT